VNDCNVFYSWQSDLANSTNRGFIQGVLEGVAKAIRKDDSIRIQPVVDRDTAGVPGSPDIAATIFGKIDGSAVFVCDVSIVNHGDKGRPTPNPNVLIELGYALKALKSDRILMVMNTAYGVPELLPFDLSKKRVITYDFSEGRKDKAGVRKDLMRKMEKALRMILDNVASIAPPGERSGDATTLKEKCEAILADGDALAWRRLISELWKNIPSQLFEWKPKAEKVWKTDEQQWAASRLEGTEICLPSIVPILAAIGNGNERAWKEAVHSLRQLSLLEREMGSGYMDIVGIGNHMLYFAGSLGMGLAVQTGELKFVKMWMALPMPGREYRETGERPWAEVYNAHRLWGQYMPGNKEPFKQVLEVAGSDCLAGFFPDKVELVRWLFLANLSQSLLELGRYIGEGGSIENLDNARFRTDMYVWPVWGVMKPDDFKLGTWDLFGSGKDILDFVFGKKSSHLTEKFWQYWKKWKRVCVQNLMQGRFLLMRNAQWLTLPGEPPDT
jgi:hypothetical protein